MWLVGAPYAAFPPGGKQRLEARLRAAWVGMGPGQTSASGRASLGQEGPGRAWAYGGYISAYLPFFQT